jgi:hypothetical protein
MSLLGLCFKLHSCFGFLPWLLRFFFYAPNCRNLPELAFACYVVLEKKNGPDSEGESLWMHVWFDNYNLGHGA